MPLLVLIFRGMDGPEGKEVILKVTQLLDEMISILLDSCRKTFPGIPVYLYGHSLGGGIVLNYLLQIIRG